MIYIVAIVALILLVLFVPPIVLIIGGIVLLIVPGFEIVEIAAVIVGALKLFLANK